MSGLDKMLEGIGVVGKKLYNLNANLAYGKCKGADDEDWEDIILQQEQLDAYFDTIVRRYIRIIKAKKEVE